MTYKEFLGQIKLIFSSKDFRVDALDNDVYWKHRTLTSSLNSFQRVRVDFINDNIGEDKSVLDIGCGPGQILKELIKRKS